MNIYSSILNTSTASQISHGALNGARVLGTVALMSHPAPWWDGWWLCVAPQCDELGMSSSWVLPLDQTLFLRETHTSLLGACSGC